MKSRLFVAVFLCAIVVSQARFLLEAGTGDESDDKKGGPKTPDYKVIGTQGASEIREYANATWAISFGRSVFGVDIAAAVATKGIFKYFAGENNQHLRIPPSIPLISTILHRPPPPHPPHRPRNGSHPHEDPSQDFDGPLPEEPPFEDFDEHPFDDDVESKEFDSEDKHRPHPPHHKNGSHPHPHPHPHPPPPPPGPPLVLAGAFVPVKGEIPVPDDHHVKLIETNTSKVYAHKFGGWAISWLIKREVNHLIVDLKAAGEKPCKGKFFVATYSGPWKILGRKNEVWWTKVPHPHHHHHNKTKNFEDEFEPTGFAAMDPMYLFPEEMVPQEEEVMQKTFIEADVQNGSEEQPQFMEGDWPDTFGNGVEQLLEIS